MRALDELGGVLATAVALCVLTALFASPMVVVMALVKLGIIS